MNTPARPANLRPPRRRERGRSRDRPGATAFAPAVHGAAPSRAAVHHPTPARPRAAGRAVQRAVRRLTGAALPGRSSSSKDHGRTATAAAGHADLAAVRPVTSTDHLRIGRDTEGFTDRVVLQTATDHGLSLDDSVNRLLSGAIHDSDHVTVRRPLNHTSGFYPASNRTRPPPPPTRGATPDCRMRSQRNAGRKPGLWRTWRTSREGCFSVTGPSRACAPVRSGACP
ncbi:serine hydrolase [Streptomyces sp. NPDC026673]|uniref:serine hydrolase n=1 Tax=Streptomyces sp. NPDC026673 TaxID=3155724 RepID=UPI0033C3336F